MTFLFILLTWFQVDEIPFRPKENYSVEIKYDLKQKPATDHNTVNLDADRIRQERRNSGPLPYLIINVRILNTTEQEKRFKVENNLGRTLLNRKKEKLSLIKIEMGYLDDVKDQLAPHTYEIIALAADKYPMNRIVLKVEKDGTFLVNGERRGKF